MLFRHGALRRAACHPKVGQRHKGFRPARTVRLDEDEDVLQECLAGPGKRGCRLDVKAMNERRGTCIIVLDRCTVSRFKPLEAS